MKDCLDNDNGICVREEIELNGVTCPIIETENLILKEINPDIINYAFQNLKDREIMNFLGFKALKELRLEKQRYEKGFTTWDISLKRWQLVERASQEVVGICGFHTWYINHFRAEVGYAITDENYKRKGLMSEAFKRVIEFGFQEMNLNRIEAFISPDNVPSLEFIQKFGFIREGRLRQHYYKFNQAMDSIVYSFLRDDYISSTNRATSVLKKTIQLIVPLSFDDE